MSKFLLIFCLFLSVSAKAQQPFWVQTNGPSGGGAQMVFNSKGDIFALTRIALFHSNDEGATWKTMRLDFLKSYSYLGTQIYISPKDFLFILHGDSLYRSKDNGNNWQIVLKNNFWNTSFLLSATGSIFIYSQANGNSAFLWRSTDDGDTWTDIISHFPLLANSTDLFRGSITPSGELIFTEQDSSYFSYSTDNGDTWKRQSILPYIFNGNSLVQGMKNGYLYCIAHYWKMNKEYGATIRSTDNGKTWDSITTSMRLIFASNNIIGNVI